MVSALGDLGDKMSQVEQGSVDEAHLLVPWHKISCGKARTAGDSERLTVGLQDGSPAVHVLRDQQGPQKLPHLRNCLHPLHPSLKLVDFCLQIGGFQFPFSAAEIWN